MEEKKEINQDNNQENGNLEESKKEINNSINVQKKPKRYGTIKLIKP